MSVLRVTLLHYAKQETIIGIRNISEKWTLD